MCVCVCVCVGGGGGYFAFTAARAGLVIGHADALKGPTECCCCGQCPLVCLLY